MACRPGGGSGRAAVPGLTGAYLGQPPPGRTPAEFAAGIVGGHFNVHSSPAFSPDGARSTGPSRFRASAGYSSGRTMMSRRAGDRWTYPERAMVGTVPLEDVPVITADGKHIYDMARRPIPGQTRRQGETSGLPIGSVIDGRAPSARPCDQRAAAPLAVRGGGDGAVYFSSRWKGTSGLFVSRLAGGRYAEPVALDAPVRASGREAMPFISLMAATSCSSAATTST